MKFKDDRDLIAFTFTFTPETVAKHFLTYTYYRTDSLEDVIKAAEIVNKRVLEDVVQYKIELIGDDEMLEYIEEEEMEKEIKDCIVDIVHIFKRRFDW